MGGHTIYRVPFFILRIIGVQSFKGSLRRSCYLASTLGEDEIHLDSQFCGGYVDPVSLNVVGYIQLDGAASTSKGYICPLGQVCKVSATTYAHMPHPTADHVGARESK